MKLFESGSTTTTASSERCSTTSSSSIATKTISEETKKEEGGWQEGNEEHEEMHKLPVNLILDVLASGGVGTRLSSSSSMRRVSVAMPFSSSFLKESKINFQLAMNGWPGDDLARYELDGEEKGSEICSWANHDDDDALCSIHAMSAGSEVGEEVTSQNLVCHEAKDFLLAAPVAARGCCAVTASTLAMFEEAMETRACGSHCLLVDLYACCSWCTSTSCGCVKTGYFNARFYDYDKNDYDKNDHNKNKNDHDKNDKANKNVTLLITVDDSSHELEGEIEIMEGSVSVATIVVTTEKGRYGIIYFLAQIFFSFFFFELEHNIRNFIFILNL